jgi:Rps23 Pro-64 3,4-dihydroxylase Tpa1-like proline 4-hydroxylase
MWLNAKQVSGAAIEGYRKSLFGACPNHIVIDSLFNDVKLCELLRVLEEPTQWKSQKHTYSALYVNNAQWQETSSDQRFVQRDVWRHEAARTNNLSSNVARNFLLFLRGEQFLSVLSRIFNVRLTDINVADPEINTNYFRLGVNDFVKLHADDSPGRRVCMLLYLNKAWSDSIGGELVFLGKGDEPIRIEPLYNRCVLFDPASKGSEHWVEELSSGNTNMYRYNVTSWYWSE